MSWDGEIYEPALQAGLKTFHESVANYKQGIKATMDKLEAKGLQHHGFFASTKYPWPLLKNACESLGYVLTKDRLIRIPYPQGEHGAESGVQLQKTETTQRDRSEPIE